MRVHHRLILLSLTILIPFLAIGQEEVATVQQGKKYLDINIRALDKYSNRLKHQQERLLKKLKKREQRYAQKLQSRDSLGFLRYKAQPLTYDSIGKLTNLDSSSITRKFGHKSCAVVDSLKGAESFIQSKSSGGNSNVSLQSENTELNRLKGELNYRTYINNLINERTSSLKKVGSINSIPGLTGIEKQVFYGKAKMKAYKEMAEEPSKAEEKALEYLQGMPGFDKSMEKAGKGDGVSMQSLSGDATSEDMEKMGLQTKKQLQSSLTEKFGKNLGGVTGKMGSQLSKYQDETKSLSKDIKQTKQSLKGLKNTDRPSFHVNLMRGLPFWKRIEKQYNWQTSRATLDGKPAIFEISAMAGFKHTPRLSYGFGISTAIGLGQNWNNIHFSWQGLGLRSYAAWQWQYGIGAYAGYERMYKQAVFTQSNNEKNIELNPSSHTNNKWDESVLIGLTKKYNINTKWNGAIQVLYDILVATKGFKKPNSCKIYNAVKINMAI